MPFRTQEPGSGLGIATCGAWIAGLALAALIVSPAALCATVIDDFNGDQPGWTLWNPPAAPSDPAALAELANHRLRIATKFTTATDPANPVPHLCNVYYSTSLPVQQGKTLELRADLVSASLADNLFSCLVTVDTKGGEYVLMWDRTEVGLFKWSQSEGFSVAFWEAHTGAYIDVVLALALEPEGDDLIIEATVTRKSTGTVAFERTVRDTPGSDWGVPDPLPRGWQIFGPDAGAPYKDDLKGVGLGVLHDTDGQQATAIVQFDNLEARSVVPIQDFYVIDDFEQGRKFTTPWGDVGQPEWDFVGGEFNVRLAKANSWTSFFYWPDGVYELAEGQPVEFRLDVVSAYSSDVYVQLGAFFANEGDDRGYSTGMYLNNNKVFLDKAYGGATSFFLDQTVAANSNPKTISLTLTREGDNMRVGVRVVLRDDPQQVLFAREVIDYPGADAMVSGQDPGPPPLGPVTAVFWNCGTWIANAEVVVDNLACSEDQAPVLLDIRPKNLSEATLAWPGINVALESDSIQGPWRPYPEPLVLGEGEYTTSIGLSGSSRYFRVVRGLEQLDSFDKTPSASWAWMWQTASVVPGNYLRPVRTYETAFGRLHVRGGGSSNEDFMLRSNVGVWYRDCVGTVDIIDWGETMEDAAFGILLRAKPQTPLWFTDTPGLPEERYAGLLTFKKADNPAESALSITGPGGEGLRTERFPAVNPDKQYRLRFWAVGEQLTLELFDRDNLVDPIKTIAVTDGRVSEGMDGMCGTKSSGETYEVWIDQYMGSGTFAY